MRSDWRARLDVELEASQVTRPTAPIGRRPLGRHQGGGPTPTTAAAAIRSAARDAQTDRAERSRRSAGFHAHRTIQRFLENRRKAIETRASASTGATAEALAFCSLMLEGASGAALGPIPSAAPSHSRHRLLIDQENEDR